MIDKSKETLVKILILLKVIPFISGLSFLIFIFFTRESDELSICLRRNKYLQELEASGIVINKYIDYENHSSERIVIRSKNKEITWSLGGDFYEEVEIGDSIILVI